MELKKVSHDQQSEKLETEFPKEEDCTERCKSITIDVWKEKGPRYVGVSLTVNRISNIKPAAQSFEAGLMVACEWLPSEKEIVACESDPLGFDPLFKPLFQFMNAISIQKEYTKNKHGSIYSVLKRGDIDNLGRPINSPVSHLVSCRMNISGTFAAAFPMHNFPFDVQDLPICIRSGHDNELVVFRPHYRRKFFFKVSQKYSALAEWTMHKPLVRFRQTASADSMFDAQHNYSVADFCLKIQRRPFHMLSFIAVPLFFITSSSMACFVLDPQEGYASRLSLLFTLLLTLVAFEFIVQGDLPKVNHLTLLDRYICFSALSIFSFVIESALAAIFNTTAEEEAAYIKVWIACYGSVHLLFIYFSIRAARCERRKLGNWAMAPKANEQNAGAFLLSGDEHMSKI